jgi:hypothetical protein
MESFELSGYWHPSTAPYDVVPGLLQFDSSDGLNLKLTGRFRSHTERRSGTEYRLDIDTIFGQVEYGLDVTLTDCDVGRYSVPREFDAEGRAVTNYHPNYCFTGVHSESGPDFSSVSMYLSNFDEWDHGTDVKSMEFDVGNGTTVVFSYSATAQGPHYMHDYGEMDYKITFRFDDPKSHHEILSDVIEPFQYLVTFALQTPVFPLELFGHSPDTDSRTTTSPRQIDELPTHGTTIIYPEPRLRLQQEESRGTWTLAHIEEDIGNILPSWYSTYKEYRPLFDLFFTSLYYDDREYPSVKVLNLTRGLEAYHRGSTRYQNHYIDKDEFEEYRQALEKTISTDFPESFRSHLANGTFKYANRVSLRKRLSDIIADQEEVLQQRLREEFDSKEMAGEIKRIRNDLTHLSDEDISKFDVEGEIMYKLRVLIEVVIADEVGINPTKVFPSCK